MAMYRVTKIMRKKRKSLHISQEGLAEGICAAQTLYRIENGRQKLQTEKYRELMKALKLESARVYSVLSGDEFRIGEWQFKLEKALYMKDYKCMEHMLAKLEKAADGRATSRQCIMYYRAILALEMEWVDCDRQLEMLSQALHFTVDMEDQPVLRQKSLTMMEISILSEIARCYADMKKYHEAFDLFEQLLDQLHEEYMLSKDSGRLEIRILCYLSRLYLSMGEQKKTANAVMRALAICHEKQYSFHLLELLYTKSGMQKAQLKQLYYIALALNQIEYAMQVKMQYQECYNEELL